MIMPPSTKPNIQALPNQNPNHFIQQPPQQPPQQQLPFQNQQAVSPDLNFIHQIPHPQPRNEPQPPQLISEQPQQPAHRELQPPNDIPQLHKIPSGPLTAIEQEPPIENNPNMSTILGSKILNDQPMNLNASQFLIQDESKVHEFDNINEVTFF